MDGLKAMDKKTRKASDNGLHLWADVDRLYVNHKEERKGLMSVEDVVRVKEHSLLGYLKRAEINLYGVLDVIVKIKETGTDY